MAERTAEDIFKIKGYIMASTDKLLQQCTDDLKKEFGLTDLGLQQWILGAGVGNELNPAILNGIMHGYKGLHIIIIADDESNQIKVDPGVKLRPDRFIHQSLSNYRIMRN